MEMSISTMSKKNVGPLLRSSGKSMERSFSKKISGTQRALKQCFFRFRTQASASKKAEKVAIFLPFLFGRAHMLNKRQFIPLTNYGYGGEP